MARCSLALLVASLHFPELLKAVSVGVNSVVRREHTQEADVTREGSDLSLEDEEELDEGLEHPKRAQRTTTTVKPTRKPGFGGYWERGAPWGPPGVRGLPGLPGVIGLPGRVGIPGPPGERGSVGEMGAVGDAGPIGVAGKKGKPGKPGHTGGPGRRGWMGEPGWSARGWDKTVDCLWDDWEAWDPCSRSCGGGWKRRERSVKVQPQSSSIALGKDCIGARFEHEECGDEDCDDLEAILEQERKDNAAHLAWIKSGGGQPEIPPAPAPLGPASAVLDDPSAAGAEAKDHAAAVPAPAPLMAAAGNPKPCYDANDTSQLATMMAKNVTKLANLTNGTNSSNVTLASNTNTNTNTNTSNSNASKSAAFSAKVPRALSALVLAAPLAGAALFLL